MLQKGIRFARRRAQFVFLFGAIAWLAFAVGCGGQPTPAQPAQAAANQAPLSPVEQALAAAKGLTGDAREAKLYEGAKKEGTFMLYSSINNLHGQIIIDAFMKKYPGVEAKFYRASSEDLYNKVLTEWRANQYFWDVMTVAPEYVNALALEGMYSPWDSPVRNELPGQLRDPNGIWTSLYLNAYAITWNTKLVKPEEAPKTHEDLLDPKWKGQISMDLADYPFAYYLLKTMGQDKGKEFLTKLAAQKPQLIKGRTNQTNLLTAGEISVSASLIDNQVIQEIKKGAPLALRYVEPVRVDNEPLMLGKNAKHPYASLLFLDWVLGKDEQTALIAATNRISPRPDVPPLNEIQASVLKGKYLLIPLEEMGKNLKETQTLFDKTFGISK